MEEIDNSGREGSTLSVQYNFERINIVRARDDRCKKEQIYIVAEGLKNSNPRGREEENEEREGQ